MRGGPAGGAGALHGGSFLLTGKTVTAWNGLSRALLGGIWTGAALYYLLGARSLLTALGSLPLGCSLYGVYLALALGSAAAAGGIVIYRRRRSKDM